MSDENETSVKANQSCTTRLYGQTHYNKEGSEAICIERQSNYENLNRFYYGMDTNLHDVREAISFILIELLIKLLR